MGMLIPKVGDRKADHAPALTGHHGKRVAIGDVARYARPGPRPTQAALDQVARHARHSLCIRALRQAQYGFQTAHYGTNRRTQRTAPSIGWEASRAAQVR